MSVLNFYNKVITSLGYIVEENGLVSKEFGNKKTPVYFRNGDTQLRLTLPTRQFLENPDWNSLCPFHPLSENTVKGESVVIKELKDMVELRVTDCVTTLMMELMEIAVDKANHKKLSPAQKKFLSLVPEANEKTLTNLSKVLCSLSNKGDRKICSFYIKRGGSIDGTPFKRVGVVSFPIIEELNKEDKSIFEVKLSTAEKKAIKNLFYYILPEADVAGKYNFGSGDEIAPNFHALCGSYLKVMAVINAKIQLFKEKEEIINLYRDIDWDVELNDLSKLYNEIPPLAYNDGEPVKNNPHASNASMNTTVVAPVVGAGFMPVIEPQVMPFNNNFQQPMPIQETTEEGKVSWNSVVSRNPMLATSPSYNPMNPLQAPMPVPGSYSGYDRGMPVGNQYGQPMYNNNPGYPMNPSQPFNGGSRI